MGESCSTQRGSKEVVLSHEAGAVPSGRDCRLNEGRRFQDEYEVSTRLAHRVRSVRNKVTKATYVVYTLESADLPCQDAEKLLSIVKQLQSLDHPNICRLLEAFDDHCPKTGAKLIQLIYEKAIGKPLLEYVAQYGFSEENAANLTQQVARALKHGDERGVCHGAMIPQNIFVSSTGKVTLTDFGLAYLLKPSPLERAREEDFAFLPPEALQPWLETALAHRDSYGRQKHVQSMSKPVEGSKAWKKEYVRKDFWASAGDMWSLGVILFKVLRGSMPFKTQGKASLGLANNVVNHTLDIRRAFHDIVSDQACAVLNALLHKNPAKRPSSEELLQHAWLLKHIASTAAPLTKRTCKELASFVGETHFKKMVMRMLVSKLPPRKSRELLEAFEAMDENQDGQVTLLELKRGLAQFPELCEGLDAPIEEVFAAIDIDNGGKISLHEFFAASLDSHDVVTDAVIVDAFRCLDTNGDGVLCKEELAMAAREIDGHLGSSHVEDLVRKLEAELGPSALNMEDFVDLVKEEGQRVPRNQAVAEEVASQSWWACGACASQRAQGERVIVLSSRQAPETRRGSKGSSASDSRRGSKSSRASAKAPDARRDSKSPCQSARQAKRSPASGRGRSPDALRHMWHRAQLPDKDSGSPRGPSPASSDRSTDCSSSPTRCSSRTQCSGRDGRCAANG